MEIEDHVAGCRAVDCDLNAGNAADSRWLLLDIGRHRDLGHPCLKRGPQRRNVAFGSNLPLAQDRVQVTLLLLAHGVVSCSRPAAIAPVSRMRPAVAAYP